MAEDVIEEATDEEGNTYFVNTVTGATGWTREEVEQGDAPDEIYEATDEDGNTYYVNSATGATGWSREEAGGASEAGGEAGAAEGEEEELPEGVERKYDPGSAAWYFEETATGVVAWSLAEIIAGRETTGSSGYASEWCETRDTEGDGDGGDGAPAPEEDEPAPMLRRGSSAMQEFPDGGDSEFSSQHPIALTSSCS